MERDQLIDLTRRAVKLARDKTTDLAPAEHSGPRGRVHVESSATSGTSRC